MIENWMGPGYDSEFVKEWVQIYLDTHPNKPQINTMENVESLIRDCMKAALVGILGSLVWNLWTLTLASEQDRKELEKCV